jgi:hypothetical protein
MLFLGEKLCQLGAEMQHFENFRTSHHHSVMMQVSKTLGWCSELMQLVAREDQRCKNVSFFVFIAVI